MSLVENKSERGSTKFKYWFFGEKRNEYSEKITTIVKEKTNNFRNKKGNMTVLLVN